MKNATFLTEMYPGKEATLWTPCLYDFFDRYEPELPISECFRSPSQKGPWYRKREQRSTLKIDGEVLKEPGHKEFLPKIGAMFGHDLTVDSYRFPPKRDIAGISPDILIIHPNNQGVVIIENKPYYGGSKFDGNQGVNGDYVAFVRWLNERNIPTEYLVIHSSSWQQHEKVYRLQCELQDHFGSLLLEDIFHQMTRYNFKHEAITEDWSDFTDKSSDYAHT
jgi:hypothetical protein